MVGNLVVAVASVAGVRASAVKTGALRGLYTREQLVAQIGSKATYDTLMTLLKGRGIERNNAQVLGGLLKKVPDPLELKGFLRKVDKPTEFLATLEQYPLNRVRTALAEMDSQSVPPDQALVLLRLKLKYPVPTRPMTPARMGRLQAEYGADAGDKTYGGKANIALKDLSPAALAADKRAGAAYQQVLTSLLDQSEYVYRFTNDYAFYDVALGGKVPANAKGFQSAFMTNVPSPNGFEAALGAQIKPQWARFTDGVPTLMVRIPRRALQSVHVPRPSGNTQGFAGWELTTSAYPEAGRGGALQFMGDIDGATLRTLFEAGEVQVTPLTSPVRGRLPVPKKTGVKP